MELWIRSQDKTFLKKVNTIGIVEGEDFWFISENITTDFGKYKTRERALEVLDEIQKLIDPVLVFKNCECDNDTLKAIKEIGACIVNDNSHIEQIQSCVYEMPKD